MSQPAGNSDSPSRRRKLFLLILGGSAIVLLAVAGAAVYALGVALHTPQKAVADYLHALIAGDAESALHLGGVTATKADPLLTDAAYRAAVNRISGYTIRSTTVRGDAATITVRIKQAGATYNTTFRVARTGKDLLVLNHWKLAPVKLGTVAISVGAPDDAAVTVSGIAVGHTNGNLSQRVFPGTYFAHLASTAEWTFEDTRAEVWGFGGHASTATPLDTQLIGASDSAATAAVNRYIDTCIASGELQPEGCPFGVADNVAGWTYSNVHWSYDTRPQFRIDVWNGTGWVVSEVVTGVARFSTDMTDLSGGLWQGWLSGIPVHVQGVITDLHGSSATYVPTGQVPLSAPPTA
ncbi:hypothetical protein [Rathayibacter soli]|uniref:hypothetical protein n=1 Tax=Rathayibacter soli TaxID=3144168 RepID=UPI0027E56AFC|nr:hypothetical protein [Glaciibacter superstes]